jgi:hypothetical protein
MTENLNAVRSIRTNSGQYVNVFEPNLDTLLIEDIAHALSNQPRFGGHLPKFYSVAQHSLLCYMIAKDEEKYDALMHDASEAYLLDMPKPIKLEMPDYNRIEDNLMNILAKKFNFNYPKSPEVERVDHYLLEWEWNSIMLENSKDADATFPPIVCLTPEEARKAFLLAYNSEIAKKNKLVTA